VRSRTGLAEGLRENLAESEAAIEGSLRDLGFDHIDLMIARSRRSRFLLASR
jgi:hypothetical protein